VKQGLADRPSTCVHIREESDVAMARKRARELALEQGFPQSAMEALATAISEIARNIVVHAGTGEVRLASVQEGGRRGIVVEARDQGPGIPDLERALSDGYSTAMSLGLGLSSARRLMDEFEVASVVGKGTTVVMKKWAP
jgi:serine/threonine-protein kinase RsbT